MIFLLERLQFFFFFFFKLLIHPQDSIGLPLISVWLVSPYSIMLFPMCLQFRFHYELVFFFPIKGLADEAFIKYLFHPEGSNRFFWSQLLKVLPIRAFGAYFFQLSHSFHLQSCTHSAGSATRRSERVENVTGHGL